LRRLIRRAIRHGRKLGAEDTYLRRTADLIVEMYSDIYPDLGERKDFILEELNLEEDRFLRTLQKGEREFEKLLPNLKKNPKNIVPGRVAFRLYDTYGFPVELTAELAEEHDLTVDREGFDAAFEKHQQLSKQNAEKSFKGGLADHTDATTRLHTATHLLHMALHIVLGDHVKQMGSNITPERLRFDFSHPEKMTGEEVAQVERIVNEQIDASREVSMKMMTVEEATAAGAFAFFNERYDEKVKVYSIGEFSKEVCGGPHVTNTNELGKFKITKEQSSSAGVRRIRAVLE
jgi:alanyl-tRNA synthetase